MLAVGAAAAVLAATATTAWTPTAWSDDAWSGGVRATICNAAGVAPESLESPPKLRLSNLPTHAWLRVRFEMQTLRNGGADPLLLLVDGQAAFLTLALGSTHEPTPACNVSSRSEFDMIWKHTAASAELVFGWPCLANSDLSRPSWQDLWCNGNLLSWAVRPVAIATAGGLDVPWEAPGADRFANASTSRLVLTGAFDPGGISTTLSGRTCQEWALDAPHQHEFHSLPGNLCRSPPISAGAMTLEHCGSRYECSAAPWCYTTDPAKRWEYCASPEEQDGTTAVALTAGLVGLEQLHVLPTFGATLALSGTLPSSLRTLWLGLSSDRMQVDRYLGGDKSLLAHHAVTLPLFSGTLPASLEALHWQLDEVRTSLSGTLPAALRRADVGGLIGASSRVGEPLALLSGTLPTAVLSPLATAADCDAIAAEGTNATGRRPHSSCSTTVMLPHLSGTLPSSLDKPSALADLTIAGTRVSGSLPAALFDSLTQLSVLEIRANNLVGEWPRSMQEARAPFPRALRASLHADALPPRRWPRSRPASTALMRPSVTRAIMRPACAT